jgi:hypothetical protein
MTDLTYHLADHEDLQETMGKGWGNHEDGDGVHDD